MFVVFAMGQEKVVKTAMVQLMAEKYSTTAINV